MCLKTWKTIENDDDDVDDEDRTCAEFAERAGRWCKMLRMMIS